MGDDHQPDCDQVVYGPDAQDVLCTCNLPEWDSRSHPLAKRRAPFRSFTERAERDGRATRGKAERTRRQDLALKHFAPTLWARWMARMRLALAAWRLARYRRRMRHV